VEKRFDVELEVLEKRQKKEIEKLEVLQINQFRVKSKQLKADQVHGAVCVQCHNRQQDRWGGNSNKFQDYSENDSYIFRTLKNST